MEEAHGPDLPFLPIFEALYSPASTERLVAALRETLVEQGQSFLAADQRSSAPPDRLVTLRIQRSRGGISEILGFRTGEGEPLAEALSRSVILVLHAHLEGELWGYTLFRSGVIADRFHSMPETLDLDEEGAAAYAGRPDVLASTWPSADGARLAELLVDATPDASALLSDFLEEMGLPGALEAAPPDQIELLHVLHPKSASDPEDPAASPEEEQEMMQAMLGAMGIQGPQAAEYMTLMKDAMAIVESAGGGRGASEAELRDVAEKLSGDTRFREVSSRLRAMGDEIRGTFDKGMAEETDPRTREMYDRYGHASGVESKMLDNVASLEHHPREGLRKNGDLLREIVSAGLHEPLPRTLEAARQIDRILESYRHANRARARDLQSALPTLAAHFVADCVLDQGGVDLLRLPAAGELRLRRGIVEADPMLWIARALSRRNPEALAPQIDRFLGAIDLP